MSASNLLTEQTASGGGGGDYRIELAPTLDSEIFESALNPITAKVEYDSNANSTTHNDACGNDETFRNGNFGVTITINGFVSINQHKALAIADEEGATIELTSALHSGEMSIESYTATRKDGEERMEINDQVVPITSFQLQLKTPGSE